MISIFGGRIRFHIYCDGTIQKVTNFRMDEDELDKDKLFKAEKMLDKTLLSSVPSAEMYFRSYMHRDVVQFVLSSPSQSFFVSFSCDGVMKLWHILKNEIEFVKQIRIDEASTFYSVSISSDGDIVAAGTRKGTLYIFRISSLELVRKIDYGEECDVCVCFINLPNILNYQLAVALSSKQTISIIEPLVEDEINKTNKVLCEFAANKSPIVCMSFSSKLGIGCSIDKTGFVLFWDAEGKCPSFEYSSIFETNYLELVQIKKENKAVFATFSNNGEYLAICCTDWQVRVYDVQTGKIVRRFNDELDGSKRYGLDVDYYNSRVALENHCREEFEYFNVCIDENSEIIIIPSAFGIKFYNIKTGSLLRIIGRVEKQERFNSMCIIASARPMMLVTAFEKQRIYLFTNEVGKDGKRDALNEKVAEDRGFTAPKVRKLTTTQLPKFATLHTMRGDIKFEMFSKECPMTVENFVTHAKRGYFDNTKITRVIRDFCIQMGDPTGTGNGGESIWGGYFEDEIPEDGHNFDEPWMVGMANEGKNKNGSQFFITSAPAPHLNGKHTCWGKVVSGTENIEGIQRLDVNPRDHRPRRNVHLVNITFSNE